MKNIAVLKVHILLQDDHRQTKCESIGSHPRCLMGEKFVFPVQKLAIPSVGFSRWEDSWDHLFEGKTIFLPPTLCKISRRWL